MIPTWTDGIQLSQHLLHCKKWILSHNNGAKLEMAQSLRLDKSWRESSKKREGLGKRRSVICDIDTVECGGCSAEISAIHCFEAISNPFSTARCMLVCPSCKAVLEGAEDEMK